MPNKNYLKGRAKEYRLKKELERAGLIVLRTAGSYGFADLIAIDKKKWLIRFIQCKPNNFSEREKVLLMHKHALFNVNFKLWSSSFEVI